MGALNWGVIERLLEETSRKIESITSTGATNAAVLAYGHTVDGMRGARAALENFWRRVSEAARFSPIQRAPLDIFMGNWTLDNSPGYMLFDLASRLLSRYDLNPTNVNPLRDLLEESIDFELLKQSSIKLFIMATNQRPHRFAARVPQRADACGCAAGLGLPAIDAPGGRDRWRRILGWRLFRQSAAHTDHPREPRTRHASGADQSDRAAGVPKTGRDILNRLNEISFNSNLKTELRGIAMFQRLLADEGGLEHASWVEQWANSEFIALPAR
jgi:NTE family protein